MRSIVLCCLWVFLSSVVAVASPSGGGKIKMIESSDNWGMYFSNMGGHPALTVFDDGISKQIGDSKLPNSIKIKLYLRDVRDDGLPTSEEGERLIRLGPVIENAISEHGGLFLGRVTTNSVRWNIGLVPKDTDRIERFLQQASEEHSFKYEVFVKSDPEKTAYWKDLYPTDDDRQVMTDMEVLQALSDRGDDQNAERPVEHWIDFQSKETADQFAKWGNEAGYQEVEVIRHKVGLLARTNWSVSLKHSGTMLLNDITHHTLKLSRKARELGGVYDGWETQVTN